LSNSHIIGIMYDLSGKDYNDFGRYDECLNQNGFAYILGSIPHKWSVPVAIGFCIPNECTTQDFMDMRPYIVDAINEALPTVFGEIKGFDLNNTLTTTDLEFRNSQLENQRVTKADFGSLLIVMFVFLFVFMVIAGTVIKFIRSSKADKVKVDQRKKPKKGKKSSGEK